MPTWLLLGIGIPLAAAAVPLIIHLINLTRYRKVDWAAMEFLLAAYQRTRRRMQLESLIMLLLRIAAVMLIAAALFPMGCQEIKGWADDQLGITRGSLNTDAPLHLIVVLDNSASMAYEQERRSAFDRAKQYTLGIVDSLEPNRDRISIVRLSDVYVAPGLGGRTMSEEEAEESRARRVRQVTSLNLEAARREIANTGVAAVDTNMQAAFREAATLAERTPAGDAVGLLVVSDFVNAGWQNLRLGAGGHEDFTNAVETINTRLTESGTVMTFYDAGYANTRNVGITNVDVGDRILGNGMEAKIYVDVVYSASAQNGGQENLRLKYRVDGGSEKVVSTMNDLRANEPRNRIEITIPPEELALDSDEQETGASRNIEVLTTDPDSLKIDNTRNFVVHVVPNVPILVVNGDPHPDPRQDEVFYLETALGVSSGETDDEGRAGREVHITPNKVVTMRTDQLAAVDSFLDYRLVILANVRDVSDGVARKLTEYVDAGYGLVFFDGDNLDFQKYNSQLYNDGEGILPVKLGRPGGDSNAATAEHYSLATVAEQEDHPVLRLFTEHDDTVQILTDPDVIRNWRNVTLPSGDEADPLRPTNVLVTINNEEASPFLVERPYGRGRVMYVSTSADQDWNILWDSPNGLPLFLYLQMAGYLTDSEARYSNLAVGQPYRRVLRESDIAPIYEIRDPAGTTSEVVSTGDDDYQMLEYAGTARPGVYTVTARNRTESGENPVKWQERFAVNLEAGESIVTRLEPVDPDEAARSEIDADAAESVRLALEQSLGDVSFELQRAGDELGEGGAVGVQDDDRLWLWLAVLGAAFLALETLWSGVISRPED